MLLESDLQCFKLGALAVVDYLARLEDTPDASLPIECYQC